ncbi:MAG: sugar phosphate isomerase/epimerase [Candidatus Brockarchaeota archaeon]|nr:sugar phosphate isomerase/epimerase [Candidatus Brockarchaeota archaeon]
MKISVCNELFEGWGFGKALEFVSRAGYDGIEIAPFTLCDSVFEVGRERRGEIREEIRSYGLECSALHWLLVKPPGLHVSHPDPAVRLRTVEYLKGLAAFADDIGCRVLVFGSPKQRSIEGVRESEGWKLAEDTFKRCVKTLEDRDVTVGIEPLRRSMTNFINKAEDAARFIEAVGSERVKLALDVYAMTGEEDSPTETIRRYGKCLVHFHANDDNERGPGTGGADYVQIARALEDVGYGGYISVEVFKFDPSPEAIAGESIRYLRKLFPRA